jgi:hypothetical protein
MVFVYLGLVKGPWRAVAIDQSSARAAIASMDTVGQRKEREAPAIKM